MTPFLFGVPGSNTDGCNLTQGSLSVGHVSPNFSTVRLPLGCIADATCCIDGSILFVNCVAHDGS